MEARREKDGTGSPRGSRETEAKPSAVQKKVGRTKGYRHSAETREKMRAARTPEVRAQAYRKARATLQKKNGRPLSRNFVPSFIDPDFDEGF